MTSDTPNEQHRDAAKTLFAALLDLANSPADSDVLPCVRALLPDGAYYDIYRAERMPAKVEVWRVRGFFQARAVAAAAERRALILCTQDGRALLTGPEGLVQQQALAGDVIIAAELCERKASELADVIAAALRKSMLD